MQKNHYTIKEIADLLGISRIGVFKKIKNGQIRAELVGKTYIISADDLHEFLGDKLSDKLKKNIEKSVIRVVKEYSRTLKLLGKE